MEDNDNKGKEQKPADTGEGSESQTVIDTKQIKSETEELEKAIAENANAKARLKIGGGTEAGAKPIEAAEETPKEYRTRINKEMAEGKTEFGN